MSVQEQFEDMMAKSRAALKVLETYNQEQIDALCKAMCQEFKRHAVELSKEVIEETRLGNYDHKVIKNTNTPDGIWGSIKGKKSVGIIDEDPALGLMYVGRPKGVVVVVAPTTNPNITALCNGVLAVKGRNTCIICSHPRAKKTTLNTVRILSEAMEKLGAPKHVIQAVEEPSIELTQKMMTMGDIIIATGGMAMVKAAYSSGKPAYGVGAGNSQTLLDYDADLKAAAAQITIGRAFDNGQVCACNQSAVIPREKFDETIGYFKENGAFYLDDPADIDKVRNTVFKNGAHNTQVVGQPAAKVAEMAGLNVPPDTSILVVKGDPSKAGAADLLCGEKMCPVLIAIPYDNFDQGLNVVKENLLYSGTGHSASIFSNTRANIDKMAEMMPVCRLLVNQPGIAAGNAFGNNALTPTTTLGCGSYGNNSLDENLSYRHLINVTQVAWINPSHKPVAEEELL